MTEHHVIRLGYVITDRWGNVGIVLEVQSLAVRIPHAERIDDSRWVSSGTSCSSSRPSVGR